MAANEANEIFWTHPSVAKFAIDRDPIAAMDERANGLVLDAVEQGWKGPPFDTFELANILGFPVIPCETVADACLVPLSGGGYQIEYNPNQPRSRIRFSIAHEIVHTFFPDCQERVRHRAAHDVMEGHEWQLEMLCNIGAAELLMPMGSFPEVGQSDFSIDHLLRLRERFQVSTEAVLLRYLKLSRIACAIFAASNRAGGSDRLCIDYVRTANDWNIPLRGGADIPTDSVANQCRAIGFTSKGDETWDARIGTMRVECVAVLLPGAVNPRVVGLLAPSKPEVTSLPTIQYLVGDATDPRGEGEKIVAHIVNDATPRWGAGFARAIANRWHIVQDDFISWVEEDRSRLSLGNTRICAVTAGVSVFHMVAQAGYGKSAKPRVRYHHLEACLRELSVIAKKRSASVHMPRIGCGQAGGNWDVVSEMINDLLCLTGTSVAVYDLPSERSRWERPNRERTLFDNDQGD